MIAVQRKSRKHTVKNNNKNKNKQINTKKVLEMNSTEENNNLSTTTKSTTMSSNNTPANKRMRDVLQNSLLGNVCKTPRLAHTESPLKLITIMDKRFDKMTEQLEHIIQTKLNEYKDDLLCEIDKRLNIVKSGLQEVTDRVTKLETVAANVISMQDEINMLKKQIKRQENNAVSSELRLNEIPYYENEDLMQVFSDICNVINISVPAIRSIYRLQNQNNKNKTNSKDAVIIVKMWSPYDKNFFLKSFSNFRKLNKDFFYCLRDIGYNSDNKFYVNENLTQQNFNILRAANRLKRNKRVYSAFSMRGLVYIKKDANDKIIQIDDISQLNRLFPEIDEPRNTVDAALHDDSL